MNAEQKHSALQYYWGKNDLPLFGIVNRNPCAQETVCIPRGKNSWLQKMMHVSLDIVLYSCRLQFDTLINNYLQCFDKFFVGPCLKGK